MIRRGSAPGRSGSVAGAKPPVQQLNLNQIPLFADLNQQEVGDVLRICERTTYAENAVICHQGEPGDSMYIIAEGKVAVRIQGPDGKPIDVATLMPGEILGELALIDEQPRSASVVAVDKVRAYKLDRAKFVMLREQLHPAAYKVLKRISLTVCGRLRRVNDNVLRLVGGGAIILEEEQTAPPQGAAQVTIEDEDEDRKKVWNKMLSLFGKG